MAKLFPPILEGTIPAFYSENGIVKITIPFSMNRAVNAVQVKGLVLKIKTVQSSSYLLDIKQENNSYYSMEDSAWVEFQLKNENDINKLKIGQFYKLQIAFINKDNDEIGYYSTVAIGKYTSKPDVYISTSSSNRLEKGIINMHSYDYTGHYKQTEDITERVYSYKFDVYNSKNELIASSGEKLHNSSNDVERNESYDTFTLSQDLDIDKSYYIQYTITTINGLKISTHKCRIMQKVSIDPEIQATLKATLNYDNGYVDIDLIGTKNQYGLETPVTGAFLITRANEDTNFIVWDEIGRFKLQAQIPSRWLWRDYTIEQGKKYRYAIQQYNDKGLYSNRTESNEIFADFEDAFLYDGYRQLKIKYNPKISSFKVATQETKLNTIGAKHPFIFRNGAAYSHEFPISGLISYYMDEDKIFMSDEELTNDIQTTNLISENLAKERIFKTKVLEWLTDGKPKVFRSPVEGNFIVRLLNTSMTPSDQLGRMIHTFNTTAYEICDFSYENLDYYGFIHLDDPEVPYMRWKTVNFSKAQLDGTVKYIQPGEKINSYPAITVRFDNFLPGTKFIIKKKNDEIESIYIGVTGSYYIDIGTEIKEIYLDENEQIQNMGQMTYSYYSIQSNLFNKISNVNVIEIPTKQFIGEFNVLQQIDKIQMEDSTWKDNSKVNILEFYNIHIHKRPIEKIFKADDGNYYFDKDKKIPFIFEDNDIYPLYAIGTWEEKFYNPGYNNPNGPYEDYPGGYYSPTYEKWEWTLLYYLDLQHPDIEIRPLDYSPCVYINKNQINVEDIEEYNIGRMKGIESFTTGNGVWCDCAYQIQMIDYLIEEDIRDVYGVKSKKEEYIKALNDFKDFQNDEDLKAELNEINYDYEEYKSQINLEDTYRKNIKDTYLIYMQTLIKGQEQERKDDGLG